MIAINPKNPEDKWYVCAKQFFQDNYELGKLNPVPAGHIICDKYKLSKCRGRLTYSFQCGDSGTGTLQVRPARPKTRTKSCRPTALDSGVVGRGEMDKEIRVYLIKEWKAFCGYVCETNPQPIC